MTTRPPGPSLSIAAANASLNEGNSGSTAFTFTVTRTGSTTGASTASYAVAGSGADPATAADFTGGVFPTGTVSFAAGETTKTITVTWLATARSSLMRTSPSPCPPQRGHDHRHGGGDRHDPYDDTATGASLSIAAADASLTRAQRQHRLHLQ